MIFLRVILFLVLLLLNSNKVFALQTDPFGMARDINIYASCIVTTVFRLALVNLVPAVVFLLIQKFITIERMRGTGEVYMDEVISLFLLGFFIALIFRLISSALTFFGIPVEQSIYSLYYCGDTNKEGKCGDLFSVSEIKSCKEVPFGEFANFAVSMNTALVRLFIIFVPVIMIFVASFKAVGKQYNLFKERKQSGVYSALKSSLDIMVIILVVLMFTYAVYEILYIDHQSLTKWFFSKFKAEGGS